MSKPGKGRKHSGPGKGTKEQCDRKPADKKPSEGAEKKTGASGPSGAQASGTSKTPSASGKTMNPADTQAKQTPKTEPAKSTKPTKPKEATTASSAALAAASKPTAAPSSAPVTATKPTKTKPSAAKSPPKQDIKPIPGKQQKTDSKSKDEKKSGDKVSPAVLPKMTPSSAGKVSAVATGALAAAGAAAAVTAVQSTKPKDESKEEKKAITGDKVSSGPPAKTDADAALDELLGTLEGPADIPESPQFTGPEIQDTVVTSEYLEELGKRDFTIPPEYRHLLDGKGEKMAPPTPPEEPEEHMDDDELVAALSSGFESSQASPEVKKPKLEEKMEVKPKSAAAVATQPDVQKKEVKVAAAETSKPSTQKKEVKATAKATAAEASKQSTESIPSEAIDELLGTLEGPPENVPGSPVFQGPEVTENITATYLEETGKRDSTIPPEYRKLLDGKDHGKDVWPSAPEPEPSMTDTELVDVFSKDFELSCSPTVQTTPAIKPKETPQGNKTKPEIAASSASTVKAAAPSGGMDSALDELLGTLEGPDPTAPESPVYTGPEVTETETAVYREGLGIRDSSIPPAYRHLLDGKVDGKDAPPPPPEEKPLTDDQLIDKFSMDFDCSESPATQQAHPVEPKVSSQEKKAEKEVVAASSATVKAAPTPSKAPAPPADPLDSLSGTLGVRKEEPSDKKPPVDKVKEGTGKEKKEKLGEDEKTIHPDRRLKEVKDKDGKPLLPKLEQSPKPMSEAELLDALTEGFVTSPATPDAPLQGSLKKKGSGSEDVISCSKASAVKSGAPQDAALDIQIPDDALDLLSGSLGQREVDPNENKPVVDVVKEKAKAEHIDKLGDRDDTIPPEYRKLLDGKDDKGQPAKPPAKAEEKPKKPLSDDAAIDALSSGFASCDTKSTEQPKQPSTDKTEKQCASAPVSQPSGKAPDAAKQANSAIPSVPKAGKS
ncbi:calpastatin isoform X15 [Xenopus tropicalis]|uniref:Calpastatin n=1 Tax=Xenopus tropicalis TaxID=8364 RepID=A0A8J0SE83_XENTR|nr:calpastatin isoform X15 [Xenopus tropicalis]|eukprot:XP_012811567.1 PREDICTED: calpastatin isoform X17 [Xenopus tropicalis]